jgi:DNA-binding response OmpR family regulator
MFPTHALAPSPFDATLCPRNQDEEAAARGVLVIDDTDLICYMLETYFRQRGLPCWSASNGRDGVAAFLHHRREIAFVLLDVGMPGLDGPRTFALLKSFDPGVPCYFMSGDCYPYTRQGLLEMGARDLLEKPFVMGSLPDILHEFRLEPVQ